MVVYVRRRSLIGVIARCVFCIGFVFVSTDSLRGQEGTREAAEDEAALSVDGATLSSSANGQLEGTLEDRQHVIVVRPAGWAKAMDDWVEYRRNQGFVIDQIDAMPSAIDVRSKILDLVGQNGGARFIVLAGDAPTGSVEMITNDAAAIGEISTVPMFYQPAKVTHDFGGEPLLVTDLPYGDFDGDGIPEAAVGRIPADTPEQLQRYLARVVAYEMYPEFENWQSRVEVTAGVGGFGLLADSAVEMATRQFLNAGIPSALDVNVTYASPTSIYCPPPEELSKTVVSNLNRGSLFWIYIGHGYIDTLDYMKIGEQFYNIFNAKQIDEINVVSGSPIAVFLACYTAAIDATDDALTERMLMRDNGPIAILAGTRVTMPYGMSIIATEMLDEYFEKRTETFGEVVLNAKRRAVTDPESDGSQVSQRQFLKAIAIALSPAGHDELAERMEHLALLELLGDPLLHLPQPQEISLNVPESVRSNETIEVTGASDVDGVVRVELQRRRDRVPSIAGKRRGLELTRENYEEIRQIYGSANDQVLATVTAPVVDGHFKCNLECPSDLSGRYEIVARVETESQWAMGSVDISALRKPMKP